MSMKQSKEASFANLSHRNLPMTESFCHRGKLPLKVTEKFQSKDYIGNLKDSPSMNVTEKESAVAPLLTLFTVTLGPLIVFLSKEVTE